MKRLILLLLLGLMTISEMVAQSADSYRTEVQVGATDTAAYFPLLRGKRVALLANHSALVGEEHLVDLLHRSHLNVTVIFSPEHGFRGTADAGEQIAHSIDSQTGIPIRSLYDGRTKRPSPEAMASFDLLLIDMQDVGVRFYTYYIAMLRMMEAATEFDKEVIILDRPNPHGAEVDGPLLDMDRYQSGVGALPIPVLHGMTLGELARLAMGEGWCPPCRLTVIPCQNYTHSTPYRLPVAPSPNLSTEQAIALYPSLCLFEGTVLSVGRGTEYPFTCYGHPALKGVAGYDFAFTPYPTFGAKKPLWEGVCCYGEDLRQVEPPVGLTLRWIVAAYRAIGGGDAFFKPIFEKLIGVDYVRRMIIEGASAEQIEACWQEDVAQFKQIRRRYLLYRE